MIRPVLLLVLVYGVPLCKSIITEAPLPEELQQCYNEKAKDNLETVAGQGILWQCEAPRIRRLETSRARSVFNNPSARRYLGHLKTVLKDVMSGRQGNGTKCVRKEYRRLNDQERERFHAAVNALKNDTSATPNRYDVWAAIHTGDAITTAHDGPNFLGWHRAYLLILERELQTVDASVCLPYWDSSLDSELPIPANSYVFSPKFLGGRGTKGPVTDGPFANWESPGIGRLFRNIGCTGQLYLKADIDNILTKNYTREVTPPLGLSRDQIEFHHNGVHNFVGGLMAQLESSAYDPAFFLHHCFVDYIWELFRQRQRRLGINPEQDYPTNFGLPEHAPNRLMGFDLNITNAQGYLDNMTSSYEYEPSPTCSANNQSCGSGYLQCNVRSGRCIPIDPVYASSNVLGTPTGNQLPANLVYQSQRFAVQNSFCIDGVCDAREWVYIAVKVIVQRSPDFLTYDCFPVFNGNISKDEDIYEPDAYPETRQVINRKSPKPYDKCQEDGIGQIFFQSKGLSYDGYYKESVIVDQRVPTSVGIGYLAVKNPAVRNPRGGPIRTLVRAYDACGRVCKVSCKTNGSDEYQLCSGVLNIDNRRPQYYSQTVGQVTTETFDYDRNRQAPSIKDNIFVTFTCDYDDKLQWNNQGQSRSSISKNKHECKVDSQCTVDVPCSAVRRHCRGERYKCRGSCNSYAECKGGYLWKKKCPRNWSFDVWSFRCNPWLKCNNDASLYWFIL